MFIWLNVLLTAIIYPFCLAGMKPLGVVLAKSWVQDGVQSHFPLSARTPIFYGEPRAWLAKIMDSKLILGVAFLGVVMLRDDSDHVKEHEAVHVIQQSCLSPIFVGLVYLFDVLAWLPFRSWWRPGYVKRASVIEKVAYKIAEGQDV